MAMTPPSTLAVHLPPTPLHGAKYDEHRPKTTRKGTRNSSSRTQRAIETPPPNPVDLQHSSASLDPTKPNTLRPAPATYSPPSSTHTSPRKRSSKGPSSNHSKDISAMDGAGPSAGAPSLDLFHHPNKNPTLQQPSLNLAATMLPTPAKTPRKKPAQPAAVQAAARVLFPTRPDTVEDAMPNPRKRRNKMHVGFSLYSSMEDDGDSGSKNQIEIYTDSKDKVPELDTSDDNPFFDKHAQTVTSPELHKKKGSKKRKAEHSLDASTEIEEAFNREEGMVYVFRGKKIYRKFPNDGSEHNDTNNLGDSERESSTIRPLTRSSIKPCLLFPTKQQIHERTASTVDDEEAPTDIEDSQDHEMTDPEDEKQVTTPVKASIFSPTTPPTTGHATRAATKKAALDSPSAPPEPIEAVPYDRRGKKISPFDGWARTKAGTSGFGGKGRKREGEAMEKTQGAAGSKKVRANGLV